MMFLFSALQKAQGKPKRIITVRPEFSQYDMEARHVRRGASCPSCDSRGFNLHVVTLEGEFKCKNCGTLFEKEAT